MSLAAGPGSKSLAWVCSAALFLTAGRAFAVWGDGAVVVHATDARCPLLASAWDGAHGAIVCWQEESSPGIGVLRAKHLLGSGELDSHWPEAGAVVCVSPAPRVFVTAIPDRAGGAYVCWLESHDF